MSSCIPQRLMPLTARRPGSPTAKYRLGKRLHYFYFFVFFFFSSLRHMLKISRFRKTGENFDSFKQRGRFQNSTDVQKSVSSGGVVERPPGVPNSAARRVRNRNVGEKKIFGARSTDAVQRGATTNQSFTLKWMTRKPKTGSTRLIFFVISTAFFNFFFLSSNEKWSLAPVNQHRVLEIIPTSSD